MYIIFLVNWFVFSLLIAKSSAYKKALLCNVVATVSFAIYAFMINELVATATFSIAALNSGVQILIPNSQAKKIKILRNILAIFAAVILTTMLYKTPADLLLCLSVTVIRLGEAQGTTRVLRLGFMIGMTFNLAFGIFQNLILMSIFQTIILTYFCYNFYKTNKYELEGIHK